jgi:hypothetical protein
LLYKQTLGCLCQHKAKLLKINKRSLGAVKEALYPELLLIDLPEDSQFKKAIETIKYWTVEISWIRVVSVTVHTIFNASKTCHISNESGKATDSKKL